MRRVARRVLLGAGWCVVVLVVVATVDARMLHQYTIVGVQTPWGVFALNNNPVNVGVGVVEDTPLVSDEPDRRFAVRRHHDPTYREHWRLVPTPTFEARWRLQGLSNLFVPHWLPALLAGVFAAWQLVLMVRRRRRARDGGCASCGYDLRGGQVVCPECGRAKSESECA